MNRLSYKHVDLIDLFILILFINDIKAHKPLILPKLSFSSVLCVSIIASWFALHSDTSVSLVFGCSCFACTQYYVCIDIVLFCCFTDIVSTGSELRSKNSCNFLSSHLSHAPSFLLFGTMPAYSHPSFQVCLCNHLTTTNSQNLILQ